MLVQNLWLTRGGSCDGSGGGGGGDGVLVASSIESFFFLPLSLPESLQVFLVSSSSVRCSWLVLPTESVLVENERCGVCAPKASDSSDSFMIEENISEVSLTLARVFVSSASISSFSLFRSNYKTDERYRMKIKLKKKNIKKTKLTNACLICR